MPHCLQWRHKKGSIFGCCLFYGRKPAATKLWALAHLLANGALIDVLLFGGFLAWAVADRISLKRRQPHAVPQIPAAPLNDIAALVLGLLVYGAFLLWLHGWLIGVPLLAVPLD